MTPTRSVQQRIEHLAATMAEAGPARRRIVEEGGRLWARARRLLEMNLIGSGADREAMELACHALYLPQRPAGPGRAVRATGFTLRERAEQAAELLLGIAPESVDDLDERAALLLRQLPQRQPASGEARLLADAVNLDGFGATGLFLQAMALARQEAGLGAVARCFENSRQYGYHEARLKDGFHFEPVRRLAQKRLQEARRIADLLAQEMKEDQPL